MIYLILNSGFKDNNPDETIKMLKIGYTDNLEDRLKAYQVANPGFILLDTREGDTRVESYLHKKFEKYTLRNKNKLVIPTAYSRFFAVNGLAFSIRSARSIRVK